MSDAPRALADQLRHLDRLGPGVYIDAMSSGVTVLTPTETAPQDDRSKMDSRLLEVVEKKKALCARMDARVARWIKDHGDVESCVGCEICDVYRTEAKAADKEYADLQLQYNSSIQAIVNEEASKRGLRTRVLPGVGMLSAKEWTTEYKDKYQAKVFDRAFQGRPARHCQICGNLDKVSRCQGCHFVYYCCRDHQKLDWVNHKDMCQRIAATCNVECVYCHQKVTVWSHEKPVWAPSMPKPPHHTDAPKIYCCDTCRDKTRKARRQFPRQVYAMVVGSVPPDDRRKLLEEHSTKEQAAIFVQF